MTNLKKLFFDLCQPAQLYLLLALLSSIFAIFSRYVKLYQIFLKLLFAIIWTLFLNFLCSKGYGQIAWVLVLLPYILIFILVLSLTSGLLTGEIKIK